MSDPDSVNPYESPRGVDDEQVEDFVRREGIASHLVSSGLLYRCVAVEAPVEATIEFYGRSVFRDIVRLNGEVVASKISWWRISSIFSFTMRVEGRPIPVVVRLQLGAFLRLKGFRIEMAGKVVYSEGMWNDSAP